MRKYFKLLFLCIIVGGGVLAAAPAHGYASTAPLDPSYNNRITDDQVFLNTNTMSVTDIQNFLNAKVPTCDTNHQGGDPNQPPPYTCLKNYIDPTTGKSSAQLIYDEATAIGLNPQVILVTLEKEEGLVTDTWPYPSQYKSAMGYGCPESQSVCNSSYYGFYNQVHLGAQLLRAGEARDCGDTSTLSSWYVNPQWAKGNSPTVDGQATLLNTCATGSLYNYTPHRPDSAYNQVNGTYYYGNYNYISYFTSWFGSTLTPSLIVSQSGGAVYLTLNGYKIVIPAMALLQDYGYDPNSIVTVPQSTIDSIPAPDQASGLSSTLSYIVKSPSDTDADGAAVYLISVGKRYQLQNMTQLTDYGFTQSSIGVLPLGYILSLPNGGMLSNYASTPISSVFQVAGGVKRIIFDYSTYLSLNPSNVATLLSYNLLSHLTAGAPISNRDILIGIRSGGVYLYSQSAYHILPSLDVYNCWGFGSSQSTPLYRLASDSDIGSFTPASTLGCTITDSTSTTYLLNQTSRSPLPSSYGFAMPPAEASDITAIAARLNTYSAPLKQAVKSTDSAAIYYLENGLRKPIPSYLSFTLLGLDPTKFDTLIPGAIHAFTASGIKLGNGQPVKSTADAGIYIINGNSRVLINAADVFVGLKNNWGEILTLPQAQLDSSYPYSGVVVSRYLYDATSSGYYLGDPNACYKLTSGQVGDFGQSTSALSSQSYPASIFSHLSLSTCANVSNYVQYAGQGAVYLVKNGTKSAFASWNSLLAQTGGTVPQISVMAASTLDPIPNGSTIN